MAIARAARRVFATRLVAVIAFLAAVPAFGDGDLMRHALEIEGHVQGFPRRAMEEVARLLPRADSAPATERRFVYGLYGQSKVLVGDKAGASELADALEAQAAVTGEAAGVAIGLLIRSAIESSRGDSGKAVALARQARDLVVASDDEHAKYWAALAVGILERTRGRNDEALASLHNALSLAEKAGNPYRRSSALYQLSVLQLALKNGPEALAASIAAYKDAELAKSAFAMANAKIAESAVMELLQRPVQELAAMEQALAIARRAHSDVAETRVLINLADLRLRRIQYGEALDLARRALALSQVLGDGHLAATAKANMGFALFGLGRVAEGRRLSDEAVADYERTGATAEIVELVGEYARNLERIGDYRGALALYHRERQLNEEIALQTRQVALLEVQEKYESEKRRREIELLNRENEIKTAEIENREFQQRLWWALAAIFAASFVVVAVLYRKLRATNELLGKKNSELDALSSKDPLTELYNRRYFQAFADAEESRTERRQRGAPNAVRALLLIDIDHFKETNDRFGHAIGDAVLVAIAQRLRATLRETDMIVRWGGEEFLVVAETVADKVDDIATRILRAISAEPIRLAGKVIRTTASIGYLPLPLPPGHLPLSWDRAIGLVDMALYMSKIDGRNRAHGIRRLLRDDPESLAVAERDLQRASSDKLVEMHVIYGPWPASTPNAETEQADGDAGSAPVTAARIAAC